jgi:hypothetical protein
MDLDLICAGRFDWDILLKAKQSKETKEAHGHGEEAPAAAVEASPSPAEHEGEEPVFSPLVVP